MFVALRNLVLACLTSGTESSKGDPLRKETYELLAADENLNFIGNVEARDLMNGVADVVVAEVSRETLCSNPLKGQPWESWACSRQLLQVVVFERN